MEAKQEAEASASATAAQAYVRAERAASQQQTFHVPSAEYLAAASRPSLR